MGKSFGVGGWACPMRMQEPAPSRLISLIITLCYVWLSVFRRRDEYKMDGWSKAQPHAWGGRPVANGSWEIVHSSFTFMLDLETLFIMYYWHWFLQPSLSLSLFCFCVCQSYSLSLHKCYSLSPKA